MPSNFPVFIWALLILIFVLGIVFVVKFLVPYFRVRKQLISATQMLKLRDKNSGIDLDDIFSGSKELEHLWQEYRDTLHQQTELDPQSGKVRVVQNRQTVPAEVYFKSDVIVDTPLNSEFFKHLPGILTGIGIIGTFFGLLKGLRSFNTGGDAAQIKKSLEILLHGVSEAFLISATAITVAILITIIEKFCINSLYSLNEILVQELDKRFDSGAGEEYLARLVKSSEESASQTSLLKDALVGDLKVILTDLADKQIAASNATSGTLGKQIGDSINEALKGPLDQIADSVANVSKDQGQAVQALLTDVLSSFSAQMKDMFGDQIAGINNLQQQTVEALQSAVVKLEEMASNVENAGQRGASAMSEQMQKALELAEARQEAMASASHAMLSQFNNQVSGVVGSVESAAGEMQKAISSIHENSISSIDKMNSSADRIMHAASEFANASRSVTETLTKSADTSAELTKAASLVGGATTTLSAVLVDYKASRDAIANMIKSLSDIVENGKREAAITSQLIQRIEHSANKLSEAQMQADQYLSQVSEVLAESHSSFSDAIRSSLNEGNKEFHNALSRSVSLLSGSINDLDEALQNIPSK